MTEKYYKAGIKFIKQNSGTLAERRYRLKQWRELALPLVLAHKEQDQKEKELVY